MDSETIMAFDRAYVLSPGFERLLRFAKPEGLLGEFLKESFPRSCHEELSISAKSLQLPDQQNRQ